MKPFSNVSSKLVTLPVNDIDTDQIIPARFLKTTDKLGLGKSLFANWRYQEDGSEDPDFVLNAPSSQGRTILLAGDNFGCGSSREHAPWALVAWGFQVILSTSFADIFRNNALKNGLLLITVDASTHQSLLAQSEGDSELQLEIDLETQEFTVADAAPVHFEIDAFAKRCLLEGMDQLQYILSFDAQIDAHEKGAGQ